MTLSKEELESVEYFGSLFFPVNDVAIMIGYNEADIVDLYEDHTSDFYRAYQRGFLLQEAKLRDSILKLALRNSSPAQDAAVAFIKSSRIRNTI